MFHCCDRAFHLRFIQPFVDLYEDFLFILFNACYRYENYIDPLRALNKMGNIPFHLLRLRASSL